MLWSGIAAAGAIVAVSYARLSAAERTAATGALLLIHIAIGIAITLRELSPKRQPR